MLTSDLDTQHPLSVELASLRAAVARFQDEAHNASVKLQRFSLDGSNAHDRIIRLERENALLHSELETLRNPESNPQSPNHPAVLQAHELTLSLRRLSDKLSLTEQTLLDRTTELTHAQSDLIRAKAAEDGAYALSASARGREQESLQRETDLKLNLRAAREEAKMTDLVLNEYADLVRKLEGRPSKALSHSRASSIAIESLPSSNSSLTLVDGLEGSKQGLQRLFDDFTTETDRLRAEIVTLRDTNTELLAKYGALAKSSEVDRVERSMAVVALDQLRADDNTAAKMVSRYMQFSQTSSDALQVSLSSLKIRHQSTISTLTNQIHSLTQQLHGSEHTSEKLRDTLDGLGKEIVKETFGRRREVALRVKLLSREEAFQEELQRILRRATEALRKEDSAAYKSALEKVASVAEGMLVSLGAPDNGTQARLLLAHNAVTALSEELHIQDQKRLGLEGMFRKSPPPPPIPSQSRSTQTEEAPALVEVEVVDEVAPRVAEERVTGEEMISQAPEIELAQSSPVSEPADVSLPIPEHNTVPISMEEPLEPPAPSHVSFPAQNAILEELRKVGRRYDELQRSFRDCHLALQDLKKEAPSAGNAAVPAEVLSATLERLDDYTEDARVELEIRVADEILLARGYETLLLLPGNAADEDAIAQIDSFTDGSDANVRKAQQNLQRKLDDIQHDIAALKRAIFDPDASLLQPPPEDEKVSAPAPAPSSGWSSWMTPSRPISPAAPTFGAVMSSPSLRRSHSKGLLRPKTPSDPLADLGLKIAMPRKVSVPNMTAEAASRGPRQRTTSNMYMLGLGARPSPPQSSLHHASPKPEPQALDPSDDVE